MYVDDNKLEVSLVMTTTNTRWYIFSQCAEEDSFGVVELTKTEAASVYKVLDADIIRGGGYTGSFALSKDNYATEEQARSIVYDDERLMEVKFC